ncbi:MAG: hypothetical protein IJ775_06140 [Muribaculaceae bacterium]|nr:hypothetical protein [Muribaculaceae bacterium]
MYGLAAQSSLGTLPATIDVNDVTILKKNVLVIQSHDSIVVNAQTHKMDTLSVIDNAKIFTPEEAEREFATQPARAPRSAETGEQWGHDNGPLVKMGINNRVYLYTYKYPSVDADGNRIYLSALMGVPAGIAASYIISDHTKPNNLIIGCHETITSNYECPSEFNNTGGASIKTGNGMMLCYASYNLTRQPCNLVIMPDYEGYGITSNRAHPYLYQELTARQVVDGARSGIALFQQLVNKKEVNGFENNWKTLAIGYSQGGSVALATHKFIELNGLSDELHFAGSVCGDGPYDPVAHLRYYMTDDGTTYDGNKKTAHRKEMVSMPIVMPLILKGMCDSNPLMRQHYLDEYLSKSFLHTESVKFIEAKSQKNKKDQYNTDKINQSYQTMALKGYTGSYTKTDHETGLKTTTTLTQSVDDIKNIFEYYFGIIHHKEVYGKLKGIMTEECYNYFKNLTDGSPVPTTPGAMHDLHRALESNNLTVGWTPQHRIAFFHSTYDTVVPYVNLLSFIRNQQGLTYYFYDSSHSRTSAAGVTCKTTTDKKTANVYIRDASCTDDHVSAGKNFFMLGSWGKVVGLPPDKQMINWVFTGKD